MIALALASLSCTCSAPEPPVTVRQSGLRLVVGEAAAELQTPVLTLTALRVPYAPLRLGRVQVEQRLRRAVSSAAPPR